MTNHSGQSGLSFTQKMYSFAHLKEELGWEKTQLITEVSLFIPKAIAFLINRNANLKNSYSPINSNTGDTESHTNDGKFWNVYVNTQKSLTGLFHSINPLT